MREVIRLVRLAALLQLAVDSAAIGIALFHSGSSRWMLVPMLLSALPTLLVCLATFAASRRAWATKRTVVLLLCGLIIAFTTESIGASFVAEQAVGTPRLIAPMQTPLLFLFIPAVLGGWVSGRRGAFGWSALVLSALVLSAVCSFTMSTRPLPPGGPLGGAPPLPLIPVLAHGAVTVVICYFVGALADRQRAEHAQLQAAHTLLAEQADVREQLATSRERLRLARDLHDTLAHTLAGQLVQVRAITALLEQNPAAAKAELVLAERNTQQGLVETRNAIADLRTHQLDLGLPRALHDMLERLQQRRGLQTTFQHTGRAEQFSRHDAETLYAIAIEALRNVERHAHASSVHVTLESTDSAAPPVPFVLRIHDDGVGFVPDALDPQRFGLRGMHERAALSGARLCIQSAPQAGTTITVTRQER